MLENDETNDGLLQNVTFICTIAQTKRNGIRKQVTTLGSSSVHIGE